MDGRATHFRSPVSDFSHSWGRPFWWQNNRVFAMPLWSISAGPQLELQKGNLGSRLVHSGETVDSVGVIFVRG